MFIVTFRPDYMLLETRPMERLMEPAEFAEAAIKYLRANFLLPSERPIPVPEGCVPIGPAEDTEVPF